jgi:hypothetical protein
MLSPQSRRSRRVLRREEKQIYQDMYAKEALRQPWALSEHARHNLESGRVSETDIQRLKQVNEWFVWALEFGADDPAVSDPGLKILIRYPSPEDEEWRVAAVVEVTKPLLIITAFQNENRH